jgi:hypothetical protein
MRARSTTVLQVLLGDRFCQFANFTSRESSLKAKERKQYVNMKKRWQHYGGADTHFSTAVALALAI